MPRGTTESSNGDHYWYERVDPSAIEVLEAVRRHRDAEAAMRRRTREDMDMGDMTYTMIKVGEGTGGGLMKNPMPDAESTWVAYVNVDDLKAATAKAKSLGATVIKDQVEVKGAGSFSIITDPTGAMLGLWEPKER